MIAAVVLAAGASSRLGRPKQLVEVEGRSLVLRTTEACIEAGCSPVVVAVGHGADRVRRAVAETTATAIVVPDWREGMAASIRAGVGALDHRARAVVLTVCDQPALAAAVIRSLVDAWAGDPEGMVAACYADTVGVPALFGRLWFGELAKLRGDRGAKPLLESQRAHLRTVPWPALAHDLDGP